MLTKWKPRLTVRAIQPVIAGLEALGHPAQRLLAEAGVSSAILADPEGQLSPGIMAKLWNRAVTITDDDCIGMHVAMAAPISAFDVHAYAMLSSPTLRDAYHRASRYPYKVPEMYFFYPSSRKPIT